MVYKFLVYLNLGLLVSLSTGFIGFLGRLNPSFIIPILCFKIFFLFVVLSYALFPFIEKKTESGEDIPRETEKLNIFFLFLISLIFGCFLAYWDFLFLLIKYQFVEVLLLPTILVTLIFLVIFYLKLKLSGLL